MGNIDKNNYLEDLINDKSNKVKLSSESVFYVEPADILDSDSFEEQLEQLEHFK
jgi:hypothetical protein